MHSVLDSGPVPLSMPAGNWRGAALATLLHLSVAVLWLSWPAPLPQMENAPVVELVLAPPPPQPQPEPPAAIAPPQPQPMAAPAPAPAKPTPRPAVARPLPSPVAAPVAAAAPVAPAAAATPAPLPAPATPSPVVTSDPDLKPTASEAPRPTYPRAARQRGLQGVVLVRVEVAADGLPTEVAVKESSGHALLDDAAVNAVRRWRFTPARAGGRAVAAIVEVPVRFTLEG